MSDTAIRVENLGKLYQIRQGYHHTLRETLMRAMSAPFRALLSGANGHDGSLAPIGLLEDLEEPPPVLEGIYQRPGHGVPPFAWPLYGPCTPPARAIPSPWKAALGLV